MRCKVYPQIPFTFIMAQTVYRTLISHTVFHIKKKVSEGQHGFHLQVSCSFKAVNVFALISFSSGWGRPADILMSSLLGSQVELWSSHSADLVKMECNIFAASDFDQVTWYNQNHRQLQCNQSAAGQNISMWPNYHHACYL